MFQLYDRKTRNSVEFFRTEDEAIRFAAQLPETRVLDLTLLRRHRGRLRLISDGPGLRDRTMALRPRIAEPAIRPLTYPGAVIQVNLGRITQTVTVRSVAATEPATTEPSGSGLFRDVYRPAPQTTPAGVITQRQGAIN